MASFNHLKAPHFIYRIFSPLLIIFWLAHAVIHSFQHKLWLYLPHRLGFTPKPRHNSLWVHASSVGEVNLMATLCNHLLNKGYKIHLSTFTATGYKRAQHLFNNDVTISILPIDCWPISHIFSARLKASCALITETELWPETLFQIAKTDIPIIHINARLSNKSLKAPYFIKQLLIRTLSYFSIHLTRSKTDISNFMKLGVAKNKIKILGNLKYASPTKELIDYEDIIKKPYLLFASSHENEEVQFCSMLLQNKTVLPLLVIAPRHPQRSSDIIKALKKAGHLAKDIAIRSQKQTIQKHTKIYIADTLGEMPALYQHALFVIMGGSFVKVGGHNILEAAALGKCTITGPSDFNIKQDIADLNIQNAIIQVKDIEALFHKIKLLLKDPEQVLNTGENAAQLIQQSQYILKNYLIIIQSFLQSKP